MKCYIMLMFVTPTMNAGDRDWGGKNQQILVLHQEAKEKMAACFSPSFFSYTVETTFISQRSRFH